MLWGLGAGRLDLMECWGFAVVLMWGCSVWALFGGSCWWLLGVHMYVCSNFVACWYIDPLLL